MTFKPLGDSAWLVEFSGGEPLGKVLGLVRTLELNPHPGVRDVVPSFASVAVHFQEGTGTAVRKRIEEALENLVAVEICGGSEHEIPVCYGSEQGLDLAEVAQQVGLSVAEVVALHSGAVYTVAAVGFSPGFPYLLGLPERLHVPRRNTPRLEVPAGSVAVAGGQAGIYPFASPGGWQVLGRTHMNFFDPHAERPASLQVGDRVRFVPVDHLPAREGLAAQLPTQKTSRWFEVIQPGGMTTVQDLGRPGYESAGVSPGGALDRASLRGANLLVGNDEGTAALEICVSGPVLKFHCDALIALTDLTGKPQRVKAGDVVDFSKQPGGVRSYLAIAGGVHVPRVLGSAATDLRGGFGGMAGRPLQAGDRLEIGPGGPAPRGSDWHIGVMAGGRVAEIELRFLSGVQTDWFTAEARAKFRTETYQLTPLSDRMGARLSGPALSLESPREMTSQPVANGSVQVPPDGQPIVLLAGRQTIGGYPQVAHVISVDLPKLARAWPGTRVRFTEVTWEQAQELLRREQQDFAWLRTGLELLK